MDRAKLYNDIAKRTQGDIYLGVVGPVRTGKSTFIKRFMDTLVVPGITDENERLRIIDELPQSGSGRTIMTTQPRFVPNEAARISVESAMDFRIRMVDCVGYMVDGALGHEEDDLPRMVRTPWYDHDIPFDEAAELGTKRVITEHSTIGVVITTDGSITGISREAYCPSEERVIAELQAQGKPFAIVLNTINPDALETLELAEALSNKYDTSVTVLDVLNMTADQACMLLESILLEFPISMVQVDIPKWIRGLGSAHPLAKNVIDAAVNISKRLYKMRDYKALIEGMTDITDYQPIRLTELDMGSGIIKLSLMPFENVFYRTLTEECGVEIADDFALMQLLRDFSKVSSEYSRMQSALLDASRTGYGMVPPELEAMQLEEPEIVQQGSRFGVRLRARASGLHLIRVDLDAEVAPLVGSEEQAEQFSKRLISAYENDPASIWDTDIFGRSLYDLMRESMALKVNRMPDNVKSKLQDTIGKMVNDGCNNVICIML
ncbi:MAG: stage IV sporulation protein A [Clostridia bacterium]|nr:stage IV sporulation protein A [Clostridia bacterium]